MASSLWGEKMRGFPIIWEIFSRAGSSRATSSCHLLSGMMLQPQSMDNCQYIEVHSFPFQVHHWYYHSWANTDSVQLIQKLMRLTSDQVPLLFFIANSCWLNMPLDMAGQNLSVQPAHLIFSFSQCGCQSVNWCKPGALCCCWLIGDFC